MNKLKIWHNEVIGNKTVTALQRNNFNAYYVANKEECIERIMAMIKLDDTVGVGGSWTLTQIGLPDMLEERGNTVYNHNKPNLSPETVLDYRHKQLACDVFLTGSNSITTDGKLVNTDGIGNRVAAMFFGPKKVIIVAGINKIVKNVAEAEERIQAFAAPINNKRLGYSNPCARTGHCMDCSSPQRTCNITTIIHRKPFLTDIHIFIIGENFGF